jgi:hypothetical protein
LGVTELPELLTQDRLHQLLIDRLQQEGAEAVLDRLSGLADLGFQAVRDAGASFSPFFACHLHLPPQPESDSPDSWWPYMEEVAEAILAGNNFADPTFGPQLLSARTRNRNRRSLPYLAGPRGLVIDTPNQLRVIRHTQVEGLTSDEAYACVVGARRGLAELLLKGETTPASPGGWSVLARARRARHPGIVFARAAANGEVDALEDTDSRLRVGEI